MYYYLHWLTIIIPSPFHAGIIINNITILLQVLYCFLLRVTRWKVITRFSVVEERSLARIVDSRINYPHLCRARCVEIRDTSLATRFIIAELPSYRCSTIISGCHFPRSFNFYAESSSSTCYGIFVSDVATFDCNGCIRFRLDEFFFLSFFSSSNFDIDSSVVLFLLPLFASSFFLSLFKVLSRLFW